jgi:cytochrome c oxidase cbb3-type subunit 3
MKLKSSGGDSMVNGIKFLTLAFALLAMTACAIEPAKTVPEEYRVGQSQFHRVCASCHGRDAMGGKRAPSFIQKKFHPKYFSNAKIARIIINGSNSGAMPSQKRKVNDQQISEIIKYIRHSQKEAGIIS